MTELLSRLMGGDRRSIGRSNEVAAAVLADPAKVIDLFSGLGHADPVVRARAADALEKISVRRPELIQPLKDSLLGAIADSPQAELRWHVAQMIPRLALTGSQRKRAFARLVAFLSDDSSIVRTFAMQSIVEMAAADRRFRATAQTLLRNAAASGTPAMKARARKLLALASNTPQR